MASRETPQATGKRLSHSVPISTGTDSNKAQEETVDTAPLRSETLVVAELLRSMPTYLCHARMPLLDLLSLMHLHTAART